MKRAGRNTAFVLSLLLLFGIFAACRSTDTAAAGCAEENGAERAYKRGEALYLTMAFTEAAAAYAEALKLEPGYAAALVGMGNALAWEGYSNKGRALEFYEKAAVLNPAYGDFARGYRLDYEKDYPAAIAAFGRAIAAGVNLAEAYTERGNCYLYLGETEKAFADYTGAIAVKPDFAGMYCARAAAYYNTGHYDEAIRGCDEARRLLPGHYLPWALRGLVYTSVENDKKALSDFNRAIRLNPGNRGILVDMVYYNRAGVYYIRDDLPRALRDLSLAIQVHGENPSPGLTEPLFELRAEVYTELGRYEDAIGDLSRLIGLAPGNGEYYVDRGENYLRLGSYDKAMKDARTALKLDPASGRGRELRDETAAKAARGRGE